MANSKAKTLKGDCLSSVSTNGRHNGPIWLMAGIFSCAWILPLSPSLACATTGTEFVVGFLVLSHCKAVNISLQSL